jgi:hypothetical protein
MVVGRCIWGKTDEEPDAVEVYRVFNANGYDVVLPEEPVSVTKGMIPQEKIQAVVMQVSSETPSDEIRVGPTLHSVMLGTVPMTTPPPTTTPRIGMRRSATAETVSVPSGARIARRLPAENRKRLESWLIKTLSELSEAKQFTPVPIGARGNSTPILLTRVASNGTLTLTLKDSNRSTAVEWNKLRTGERAILAKLVAERSPADPVTQAAAGVYLESLGEIEAADTCFARSDRATLSRFEELFVR